LGKWLGAVRQAPRQIASGLREHYTLEQMDGRKVRRAVMIHM
jgi:tRNA-binding EMAP/Myf-like protein